MTNVHSCYLFDAGVGYREDADEVTAVKTFDAKGIGIPFPHRTIEEIA
jgi:hypothetical protein